MDKINKWSDEKTHGKIIKTFDRLGAKTVMVLLNSVYFKGTWKSAFTLGQPHNFNLLSGRTKHVPTMLDEIATDYLRGSDF